jgi:hypothetical protein
MSNDVCWGHDTGVTEDNVRDFSGNWTGTGTINNPAGGDAESLSLDEGEYEDSEAFNIGPGTAVIELGNYVPSSGPTPDIYYKTGVDQAACLADSWHLYGSNFTCTNWGQVRLQYPGDFLFSDSGGFFWEDDGSFEWEDS